MGQKYVILTEDELSIIRENSKLIFTGISPLKGETPFVCNQGTEIIAEWFRLGDSDFEEGIKRVVKGKGLESFLILDCSLEPVLEITKGYRVSIDATSNDLQEFCSNEFWFCIKGTDCIFLDESFSWAIQPLIDIQLVYGDSYFFKKYYVDEQDKIKAINDVSPFFTEWELKESYRLILQYIEFSIAGEFIHGEKYYRL